MARRSNRVRIGILLLLVLALVGAACGGSDDESGDGDGDGPGATDTDSSEPVGEPQAGGTLRYGLTAETNSWDPAVANWSSNGWTVARAFFDTLVMYDENLELRPYLAETVEPNDDHTVWTFTIREGITFHNGEALTAEVVKANIDRHLTSALTGTVFEPVESVEVADERTVVITLDRPWVRFPTVFTGQPGIMMAPEMIESPDGGLNPIGTGPFVFDDWVVDDQLTVVRNDDYWNEPPLLDGIEFRVITDHRTRQTALENDELDSALITLAQSLVDFREAEDDGWQMLSPPAGEETEVLFLMNLLREPFTDREVREALALALDKETLIETIREGLYEPADGMYPPDSPWHVETDYPQYDRDRAAQIVEEWEAENGPLSFTLGSPQEDATLVAMQAVQEQWQAVGIDVEIATLEATEYISSTLSGDYDLNVWQFYGLPHPDSEYVWLHSDFAADEGQLALNFGRIRSDVIDEALDEERGTDDEARQKELYGIVQQEMADQVFHLWLYHDYSAAVTAPDVHGILDWDFPDGTPGAGMIQIQPVFHDTWIEQ
jgi:peptide/nickel transport system substrate-binding protein